jgi:hypothetical protein
LAAIPRFGMLQFVLAEMRIRVLRANAYVRCTVRRMALLMNVLTSFSG